MHHLLVCKCCFSERLTETTTERRPNASPRRAQLSWNSGSETRGFPKGDSGGGGVGPAPKALPRERRVSWTVRYLASQLL